ncbi:MAG: LacI family DNA-binding transcriptional regulator [Lachnospiraceae bacterium]|nr:LacI family DNA-binding transcriptional regulator [Lachnospiraceae bacterium]
MSNMTIKEVARMAGVSPAAVSRYFNGGSLGKDKQLRIRNVVEKTGFRPNPLAQTMRTGRSGQIGVIVPKIQSDSVTRILKGISDVIREENCIMILGDTEHDEKQEVRLFKAMQDNHVDGIILMGRTMTKELRGAIAGCPVPVVVTGQRFEGVTCVYHDDFHAMEELAAGVLPGRKHPAFIGVLEEDEQAGRARREGFDSALRKAGFDPEKVPGLIAEFTTEDGARAASELLRDHPETDAVLCASDFAAFGVLSVIRESGRKIPEDIAVAGCGDIWAASFTDPALTSVRFFYEECGREAARLLMERIRSGSESPESRENGTSSGEREERIGGAEPHPAPKEQQIMLGYSISWRGSH